MVRPDEEDEKYIQEELVEALNREDINEDSGI